MKTKQIFTIGHSTYKIDYFISLLENNKINTLVDVRSTPYSQFSSQYNRESIKFFLKEKKILYLYMGDLLGARYTDKNLLSATNKVDFKKVQSLDTFQQGISRLLDGINKGYKISLMCSEKEAFDCHRFGLISEFLYKKGIDIDHIYPDGLVKQKELEERLLNKYAKKIPQINLFNSNITTKEQLEVAYKLRNEDIGYNPITNEGDDI